MERQDPVLGYYLEEAREHLNTIARGIENINSWQSDSPELKEVFRAAHSLKGGAAMLGLNNVPPVAQYFESAFQRMQKYEITVNNETRGLFRQGLTLLERSIWQWNDVVGDPAATKLPCLSEAEESLLIDLRERLKETPKPDTSAVNAALVDPLCSLPELETPIPALNLGKRESMTSFLFASTSNLTNNFTSELTGIDSPDITSENVPGAVNRSVAVADSPDAEAPGLPPEISSVATAVATPQKEHLLAELEENYDTDSLGEATFMSEDPVGCELPHFSATFSDIWDDDLPFACSNATRTATLRECFPSSGLPPCAPNEAELEEESTIPPHLDSNFAWDEISPDMASGDLSDMPDFHSTSAVFANLPIAREDDVPDLSDMLSALVTPTSGELAAAKPYNLDLENEFSYLLDVTDAAMPTGDLFATIPTTDDRSAGESELAVADTPIELNSSIPPAEGGLEMLLAASASAAVVLDLTAAEVDNISIVPTTETLADLDGLLTATTGEAVIDKSLTNNIVNDAENWDNLDGLLAANSASELDDLDGFLAASSSNNPEIGSIDNNDLDDLDDLLGESPSFPATGDISDLDALLAPTPVPIPAPVKVPTEASKPRSKNQRTFEPSMKVSVKNLNNVNNLAGELVINRNSLEQDQQRMRQFVDKLLSEVQKLNDVGKRMQDLYERSLLENSLVASRERTKLSNVSIGGSVLQGLTGDLVPDPVNNDPNKGAIGDIEYDPLEMDRFTPIHLLSQKMIELIVRVRESASDIEFITENSDRGTRNLRQITGRLQEDLTKIRMIPFAQTADRLQRGVRDNGMRYGKEIELHVEGRDTPVDKVILESLTDPLTHMINNAIAHGIEDADTRRARGKNPIGQINVRAFHQGNQTIVAISDDGAGIDIERVKAKAMQNGLITSTQAATMSKVEAYELLFLPNFSTKDVADELAGRGVGMDVVRTSLQEIRGTIATESQLGLGTTFTIRLPLALSITKALMTVDRKLHLAIPLDGIEDTQDVPLNQIQTDPTGQKTFFWRDRWMPFQPMANLLSYNRPLPRASLYAGGGDESDDTLSILILRSDNNFLAVQVDRIVGEQEIAIKPLQGSGGKPIGIAGVTLLGDGRIVPIADVLELIDLSRGTILKPNQTAWLKELLDRPVRQDPMVLIVDDSITVRELLSLTFTKAGYRVEQARDGQEAWDKLRAGLPCALVFCDIEMPRMDGLELLSRIHQDTTLQKTPVAMLTSRGSDRHRQIASQLGASGYFVKPYLEEALLDAAKRMMKGEKLAIV